MKQFSVQQVGLFSNITMSKERSIGESVGKGVDVNFLEG